MRWIGAAIIGVGLLLSGTVQAEKVLLECDTISKKDGKSKAKENTHFFSPVRKHKSRKILISVQPPQPGTVSIHDPKGSHADSKNWSKDAKYKAWGHGIEWRPPTCKLLMIEMRNLNSAYSLFDITAPERLGDDLKCPLFRIDFDRGVLQSTEYKYEETNDLCETKQCLSWAESLDKDPKRPWASVRRLPKLRVIRPTNHFVDVASCKKRDPAVKLD